jgi:hypothetical protein
VEERDRPHYLELLRLLDAVDNWLPRIDPVGERVNVHPRSPLHQEDERTHPYETSSGVWHALSHAVDQLACLRSLLRDAQMIHMYAPYSLVRPALENASAAVWILHPASRARPTPNSPFMLRGTFRGARGRGVWEQLRRR